VNYKTVKMSEATYARLVAIRDAIVGAKKRDGLTLSLGRALEIVLDQYESGRPDLKRSPTMADVFPPRSRTRA
jgi:hypothetical protein